MRTTMACGVGLLTAAALTIGSGTARANGYSHPYLDYVKNNGIHCDYGYSNCYDDVSGYIKGLYGYPYYVSVYASAKVSAVWACKSDYGYAPEPYYVKDEYVYSRSKAYKPNYYFDVKLYPPVHCSSEGYYPVLACIKYSYKKAYFPYHNYYISKDAYPSSASKVFELGYEQPYEDKCNYLGIYPSYSNKSKAESK